MKFSPNSGFLFVIAAFVVLFVIAQSVFFLIRAYKRGMELGIEKRKLKKTIISSAIFSVAPAISILLGVITLSKFLGLPLPWIRMSVIGAITYELPAATSTATALGISLSETVMDAKVFSAIAWVMTLGVLPSIVLVPILLKRIQTGLVNIRNKDSKWGDIFIPAIFLGMIAAFSGMVFSGVHNGLVGWIPVFVLFFSAIIMGICGLLIKKCGQKWLENYALPISMLSAMIFSILITPIIVG